MALEQTIILNRFHPREYQLPIFDAIENKGYRRVLAILPRRAGKDVCAFNLVLRAALKRIGVYYYIFPEYSQAKKVIWDSITNEGNRFLDYIPKELVRSSNSQELKITLTNGSIIQLVGSDRYNSLMGTNPRGVVFSEYSIQDPRAYQYIRPILTANDGWALFLSTPRGKNHLWDLYKIALNSPEWFSLKLTLDDTKHIPLSEIEKERAEGIMSEDLIQQEYYTSFEMGVEGAYYSKYLDQMRIKGQISVVPHEAAFRVSTSWDIGNDATSIIFFQIIGQTIRLIDCYESSNRGMEHFINVVLSKGSMGYIYDKHWAPHDIRVRDWGGSGGITREEKAKHLGVRFHIAPPPTTVSLDDGIESVRSAFSKMWIDSINCAPLIKALENYRQEWDERRKSYNNKPIHDWASHYADSMRYLCISLPKMRDGKSAEDIDRIRNEARYGDGRKLPPIFQDNPFGEGWR